MDHGTRYEEDAAGRLLRIVDRTGAVHAGLRWSDAGLDALVVAGAIVRGERVHDPLFGRAHPVELPTSPPRRVTTMTPLDWARPTEIPAVAAPAALPFGTGGAIMNVIAVLARRAGVAALRYAGPYPTAALWTALSRSFAIAAAEDELTRDFFKRAALRSRDPMHADLIPAPHDRVAFSGGHVELRDGLERAVIDRVSYVRGGSPARLVDRDDLIVAEVWFGDAVWAEVARFAPDGSVAAGPHPIPPCKSDVLGKAFPPPLRAAIADLVAEVVPAPLGPSAKALVSTRELRWADLGARAARATDDAFEVHAALWERIAPAGLARLALALAEALGPVVTSAVVADVTRA